MMIIYLLQKKREVLKKLFVQLIKAFFKNGVNTSSI